MQRSVRFVLASVVPVGCGAANAPPPPFHSAVQGDAPLLWYKFNEASGTEAINSGSLGPTFNGTYISGPVLQSPTIGGDKGVAFNAGIASYVESIAAAPVSMTGNPTFTAEAVVYVPVAPNSPNYAPFLTWGTVTAGQGVFFGFWSNDVRRVYTGFSNGGSRTIGQIAQQEWTHIVWVRQGGGNASTGNALYVNGQPVGLQTDGTATTAVNLAPTRFRVERGPDGTGRYFTGVLDEVALYDRALTPAEILEHHAALHAVCIADSDGDGDADVVDIFVYLSAWFAGCL